MPAINLSYLLLVLLVNLWGLTLFTGWFLPNRWAASAAGPWIMVSACFALESHWGLGKAEWLGVVGTVCSVGLIYLSAVQTNLWRNQPRWLERMKVWREEFAPRRLWPCGAILALFFLYALVWRYATPNIDGSSEKIADLANIASYYSGATIPVPDAWFAPHRATQYYSFQYYAAALAGRTMGWNLGLTYNLAYCVMIGLTGLSFAGAVFVLSQRAWIRGAVLAALFLSGSGVSGFVHLVFKAPQLWNTVRFIGIEVPYDGEPAGPALMKIKAEHKRVELPGESFSYTATLGDYHPPLSGYYLLGVAVTAAVLAHRTGKRRYAALVGGTLTWSILANTWTFPLQFLGVAAWALWHYRQWKILWPSVVGGALAVWFANAIYLDVFTAAAAEYNTAIRLVKPGDHTPLVFFLLFLWPTLLVGVAALYGGRKSFVLIGAGILAYVAISELIFIDDVYVVEFERFNTTLKWWPWIASAALLVAVPLLLEHATRTWVRVLTMIAAFYPCVFAYDLASYWMHTDHSSMGRLEGSAFLMKNERSKYMLIRLRAEPHGVVLERPNKDSFTSSAVLPILAGHRMWLGWMGHELLWRGYSDDVRQRQDRLFQFYKAEMAESLNFLRGEQIDYVLWYQDEDTNELWSKIDQQIRPGYAWVEIFSGPDGRKTGMWRRTEGRMLP